jgi:hypothetical protein
VCIRPKQLADVVAFILDDSITSQQVHIIEGDRVPLDAFNLSKICLGLVVQVVYAHV